MYRTGFGYDLHRLVSGRRLVLGGVEIPHELGLLGHSDADIVLHAVCDALLGAAGLGDIGEHFPDTDARFKDADSRELMRQTLRMTLDAGYEPVNVDVVIHAERPKLREHKPAIRAALAELLGIDATAVGVKATTNEGLDAIGRGEAMACSATALLRARKTR